MSALFYVRCEDRFEDQREFSLEAAGSTFKEAVQTISNSLELNSRNYHVSIMNEGGNSIGSKKKGFQSETYLMQYMPKVIRDLDKQFGLETGKFQRFSIINCNFSSNERKQRKEWLTLLEQHC